MHRALGRASLAWRICVFGLRRAGCLAAEGSTAGLRVRHLPPAGVGDGGNRVSSDADGSDEVVSCRLSDGPRQAWCLGQIPAARTDGGLPDGLDHGAQVAPRAERRPDPSAARLSRGGRDPCLRRGRLFIGGRGDRTSLGRSTANPDKSLVVGAVREGAGAKEQEGKTRARRQASARVLCRQRADRRAAGRDRRRTRRLPQGQCRGPMSRPSRTS